VPFERSNYFVRPGFHAPNGGQKTCYRCGEEKPLSEFKSKVSRYTGEIRYAWCWDCHRAYAKATDDARRQRLAGTTIGYETQLHRHLKHKYGLTRDEFRALEAAQGGRCYICQERPRTRLFVDHDHETGRVRKLLCRTCNAAIGFLRESPEIAERLASYLRDFRRQKCSS
jgi:hypothetical protein